ncbi:polysaccharide biosynthesis/export family protein [Mucilaginibacter pedocola]|uniref:Uncharacterized protein n=1 Tax=Mucilaginibacter pedocola TaxID=1792845 RepID=A0A1S9P9Z2_9SPHI|nr:polysaccharide biosynthesis/export family protein [Mucilaginibacter pedocola]OOQ57761.1 hypothetical protein BC343_13300 [Mucilaginibacter pedocola]
MAYINKKTKGLLAVMCGVLLMANASCSYKQNQVLFEKNAVNENMPPITSAPPEYKIETQDVLQMRNLQDISYVYSVPGGNVNSSSAASVPQAQTYQVENDSTVALPVLGKVKVAGLTKLEAANKIQSLYAKSVLKNPIIELKIMSLKVAVFGEVRNPGSYMLVSDKTTLVDMIAQAGGLTEKADEKTVKIVRGGMANARALTIDLNDFRSVSNPATILQSKDVIYVAQNKRAIKNEKIQDISTLAQPGLLLLNTALLIITLGRR